MTNPLSNKKKIRGWKRRIGQIKQWKQAHMELDTEQLTAAIETMLSYGLPRSTD